MVVRSLLVVLDWYSKGVCWDYQNPGHRGNNPEAFFDSQNPLERRKEESGITYWTNVLACNVTTHLRSVTVGGDCVVDAAMSCSNSSIRGSGCARMPTLGRSIRN